jgi:hypothetical protein
LRFEPYPSLFFVFFFGATYPLFYHEYGLVFCFSYCNSRYTDPCVHHEIQSYALEIRLCLYLRHSHYTFFVSFFTPAGVLSPPGLLSPSTANITAFTGYLASSDGHSMKLTFSPMGTVWGSVTNFTVVAPAIYATTATLGVGE